MLSSYVYPPFRVHVPFSFSLPRPSGIACTLATSSKSTGELNEHTHACTIVQPVNLLFNVAVSYEENEKITIYLKIKKKVTHGVTCNR